DDAEVINPYKEADPYNRPPPTSDKETEFAPHVVQIADGDDNGQEFDITALDSAVRENRSESSKMMRLITDLRKNQNRMAEELRR
nr:hypothetical protein [Tanacetum cinerariifolium]